MCRSMVDIQSGRNKTPFCVLEDELLSASDELLRETGQPHPVERLHAKFHLNVFIVSASRGQKPQFWANFDIFGAPVPTPFYR